MMIGRTGDKSYKIVKLESKGWMGGELAEPTKLNVKLSTENLSITPDSSTEPLKGSEMGHIEHLQNKG